MASAHGGSGGSRSSDDGEKKFQSDGPTTSTASDVECLCGGAVIPSGNSVRFLRLPNNGGWDRRFRIEASVGEFIMPGFREMLLFVAPAIEAARLYRVYLQDEACKLLEFDGVVPDEHRAEGNEHDDGKLAERVLLHLLAAAKHSPPPNAGSAESSFRAGRPENVFEYEFDGKTFEAEWHTEGRWLRVSSPHGASRAQWDSSDQESPETVGRKLVRYLIERNILSLETVPPPPKKSGQR